MENKEKGSEALIQIGNIIKNKKIAKDVWEMILEAPDIAKTAQPGQFINLRLSKKLDPLLRRPISLHNIDAQAGTITMYYLVAGKGTEMMTQMKSGTIDVLGPLGNGWNLEPKGENVVLVGGGIGIAPMYPLAKELLTAGKNIHLIIGAKSKEFLTDIKQYENLGIDVKIATDDGTYGHKGFVTELLSEAIEAGKYDYLYACGPTPMLKFVEKIALSKGVAGQVSTESHMGCGIGVCLCCPNKVKTGGYKRTCKDGPVFMIGDLDYE